MEKNAYPEEEVNSKCVYPSEYRGPRSIAAQVQALKGVFPELREEAALKYAKSELPAGLPPEAEGWFAIPRWQRVAGSYADAVALALRKLAATRTFTNYREGELDSERLSRHPHTAEALERVYAQQRSDILIIPAQYGLRHRGRSIRRARSCFSQNEFGLGAFEGCSMALVHPERYVRPEELDTDFPGDEYRYKGVVERAGSPLLRINGGHLKFYTFWSDYAHAPFGSATAFLLQ